ncbi:hypothetical protein [Nitrobacter sp. TKz-YC02]|uniref:hypothetical protein n=1 Tax=Nitrobacter sp. TKz-YC02 TaxID=3398704 RepID=UPI003CEEA7BF
MFDAVQHKLTEQWTTRSRLRNASDHLLTGLLFDDVGNRMVPTPPLQHLQRPASPHLSEDALHSYMSYYNGTRTHLSLNKDAPISRAVETAGRILCRPILGGLHHQYVRI